MRKDIISYCLSFDVGKITIWEMSVFVGNIIVFSLGCIYSQYFLL